MHILYIISSQIHTSAGGMEDLQDSLLHVTQQLLAPLVLLPILVNSAEAIGCARWPACSLFPAVVLMMSSISCYLVLTHTVYCILYVVRVYVRMYYTQ